MALYNVTTAGNTLLATAHDAHATSEVINQNVEDTDFESIRETRVHWKLANIVDAASTANKLVTNTPLNNGDRLFIRLANGVIYDTIAAGVVPSGATIHAPMTSLTLPAGVVASNTTYDNNHLNAWLAFDGSITTSFRVGTWNGATLSYQFQDNVPTTVYKYFIKYQDGIEGWVIEGSLDGINWATISTESVASNACVNGLTFNIDSPGAFSNYRFRVTDNQQNWGPSTPAAATNMYAFHLLTTDGTSADTTAITNGAIPTHVFKFEDTIKFNGGNAAIEKDIFYEYGSAGTKLYVLALYHDVLLDGRILTTRLDFSSANNEVTEITGQIFKLV